MLLIALDGPDSIECSRVYSFRAFFSITKAEKVPATGHANLKIKDITEFVKQGDP